MIENGGFNESVYRDRDRMVIIYLRTILRLICVRLNVGGGSGGWQVPLRNEGVYKHPNLLPLSLSKNQKRLPRH